MKQLTNKERHALLFEIFRKTVVPRFSGLQQQKKRNMSFDIDGIRAALDTKSTSFEKQSEKISTEMAKQLDNRVIKYLNDSFPLITTTLENFGTWRQLLFIMTQTNDEPIVGLVGSRKMVFEIKRQSNFHLPQQYLQKGDIYFIGEIGMIGNVRVVKYDGDDNDDECGIIALTDKCFCIDDDDDVSTPSFKVCENTIIWEPKLTITVNPDQIKRFHINNLS